MKKYLSLTLLLGAVHFVVGWAVALGVFRDVDLRFRPLLGFLLIPPFQAAILMWVRRDPAGRPLLSAPGALRNRAAIALLCIDLAILTLLLTRFPAAAPFVFGAHALIAAGALLLLLRSVEPRNRWVLVLTAAGLALYGISGFWDWLALLPGLLGRSSTILRWAAAYGSLFIVTILVLLRAASSLGQRSLAAAGWIEISIGLLLLAALVLTCSVFFRPYLIEPWKTLQRVLAYTSVTAILVSALAFKASSRGVDVP